MIIMFFISFAERLRMPKVTNSERLTAFGVTLDRLLAERGWNQQQLSDASDPHVSQGMISNYRNGVRRPSEKTSESLARAIARRDDGDTEKEEQKFRFICDELLKASGKMPKFGSLLPINVNRGVEKLTHDQKLRLWESMGARTYRGPDLEDDDFQLPENPDEWPDDLREALQEALFYTRLIPPDLLRTVIALWRDQAKAHAGSTITKKELMEALKNSLVKKQD